MDYSGRNMISSAVAPFHAAGDGDGGQVFLFGGGGSSNCFLRGAAPIAVPADGGARGAEAGAGGGRRRAGGRVRLRAARRRGGAAGASGEAAADGGAGAGAGGELRGGEAEAGAGAEERAGAAAGDRASAGGRVVSEPTRALEGEAARAGLRPPQGRPR
ncbi:unnamed protein product [Urochloa humidicola]